MNAITERAMVLNVSISQWSGRRLDKGASAALTEANHADTDAARVNKLVVPKASLRPIEQAGNAIRTHFYSHTLPWKDNGDRIITRKMFEKFMRKHGELESKFNAAVQHFLTTTYPEGYERAQFRMGSLFNPSDYPTPSSLQHKFSVTLNFDLVTSAHDFRVDLDEKSTEMVRKSMEASIEKRVHEAMADVWRRMAETVSRLSDRMGDPDATFKVNTLRNIDELVEMIPGLNLLDDPRIEEIRQEIDDKLTALDAKEIRADPTMRSAIAGEAQEIMDKMAGFMAAFQEGSE